MRPHFGCTFTLHCHWYCKTENFRMQENFMSSAITKVVNFSCRNCLNPEFAKFSYFTVCIIQLRAKKQSSLCVAQLKTPWKWFLTHLPQWVNLSRVESQARLHCKRTSQRQSSSQLQAQGKFLLLLLPNHLVSSPRHHSTLPGWPYQGVNAERLTSE